MHLLFERSWDENRYLCHFKEYHGNYMVLGEAVSKLETFVWILKHISRFIAWSVFILKASYLVKWPISTWSWYFMWWCQFIDLLKFKTRPSFLLNFRTANYSTSYLTGLFDIFILLHIWQNFVCFGNFLPMRTLCDACHNEFESH